MTDSAPEDEIKTLPIEGADTQHWADVFYGVLVAPRQTMTILADNSQYKSDGMSLVFAAITVLTSSILASIGVCGGDVSSKSQLCIGIVMFLSVANWALLSLLLHLISRIISSPHRTIGSAFIVTGWAYLPLYFINPVKCLLSVPAIGTIVVVGLACWMILLECVAYRAVLNFNRKRTIAMVFGVPILYKLTLVCELFFLLSILI